MKITDLLDRPIAFHRVFVTLTGSVNAALLLSQSIYWSKRTRNSEGWFWKTQEEWEEETGLTRYEQETARKSLRKLKLWKEIRKGVPPKLYFHVDEDALSLALCNLFQYAEIQHSKVRESNITECGNPAFLNAGIQHSKVRESSITECGNPATIIYTETTSETTSETTQAKTTAKTTNDDDDRLSSQHLGYSKGGVGGTQHLTAFADTELRTIAWQFGALLGLTSDWDGYADYIDNADYVTLINLIEWIHHYNNQPNARHDQIHNLVGILRNHINHGQRAQLSTEFRHSMFDLATQCLDAEHIEYQ